jgi:hypothetical protein
MTIDPRTGARPAVGRLYRVEMHDADLGRCHAEYVRVVRISDDDLTFHAVWLTATRHADSRLQRTASAHLFGDRWYRTFTPVYVCGGPGGALL